MTTGSDGVGTVNAAPNGVSETTVDVEWNARGYFGAGGRVGLIDQGRIGLDTKGDGLRVSLSWSTCSTGQTTSTGPTDFDIFLFNRNRGSYLFSSQSVFDNNEGFQVSIPDGWDGNYDVYLSWPKASTGCNAAGIEAVSAMWGAWRP